MIEHHQMSTDELWIGVGGEGSSGMLPLLSWKHEENYSRKTWACMLRCEVYEYSKKKDHETRDSIEQLWKIFVF